MTVRNNYGIHFMHTIQLFFKLPADPAMADTPNIAYTIFIFISSQLNNNNESIFAAEKYGVMRLASLTHSQDHHHQNILYYLALQVSSGTMPIELR